MQVDNFIFNCDLEDILQELRLQLKINHIQLLEKEPRQSGNSLQIQCPFHGNGQERKPSAGIRKSDGKFHCFACGEIHELPEVISHCFGHDDMGAFGWQWLMRNFATVQKEQRKELKLDLLRNNVHGKLSNVDDNTAYITEQELDTYRYYHPYWAERKITDERLIELFDLGYDKKTNCITFPVRDENGNCLFIARRSVKTKYFHYPQGVKKPLYGLYELKQLEVFPISIVVCESMLDALTVWEYGDYAVALNGLGNALQFEQLRKLPCRELILATDNDEAGQKARDRISRNIRNKIVKEFELPEGKKDINELSKLEYKRLPRLLKK